MSICKRMTALALSLLLLPCGCRWNPMENRSEPERESAMEATQAPRDNILRLGVSDFDTYHPYQTASMTVLEADGVIYEPLYKADRNGRVIPVLAAGFEILDGGRSILVTMKQGVRWHDGTALTAQDAAYSARLAAADPKMNYGFISGASARNQQTVVIQFNRPVANMTAAVTFPVVKNQSAGKTGAPVGTGPYRYNGSDSVSSDIFYPFEAYHGTAGAFESVRIYKVSAADDIARMFQIGELDVLPAQLTDIGSFTARNGTSLEIYTTGEMAYLGINFRNQIFWGVNTRRALGKIIDKKNIVNGVYYQKAEAADAPASPDSWLNSIAGPAAGKDLSRAETDMASDGWKRGGDGFFSRELQGQGRQDFEVKLLVNQSDPSAVEIGRRISEDMNTFGMRCVVDQQEENAYFDLINSKNYDIFIGKTDLGPNVDYSGITPVGGNVFTYVDNGLESELTGMCSIAEETQLQSFYGSYAKRIIEDVPYVVICFEKGGTAHSAKLQPSRQTAVSGGLFDIAGWTLKQW